MVVHGLGVSEMYQPSSKCQKMKNARAKRAKNTVFHCQICKFVGFLLLSSSWLLKLPSREFKIYDATAATTPQILHI